MAYNRKSTGSGSLAVRISPVSQSGVMTSGSRDASYWDKLFKNTPYEDLYYAILEQYADPPSSGTGLGSLISGITGQADRDIYSHNQARNNALTALAQKMYNEEYESPAAEVARNAAAGLNSDLLGTSGVNGASTVAPDAVPGLSERNYLSDLGTAAGIVSGVFNTGMSFLQGMMSFKSSQLSNQNAAVELLQKELGLVSTLSGEFGNFFTLSPDGASINVPDNVELDPSFIERARAVPSFLNTLPRSQRKRVSSYWNKYRESRSARTHFYKTSTELNKARRAFAESGADPWYSVYDDVFMDNFRPLLNAQKNETLELLDLGAEKRKFDTSYWTKMNSMGVAEDRATDEFSQLQYSISESQMMYRLKGPIYKTIQNLENTIKNGNKVERSAANALLISLYGVLRANISRTSGPKGVSTTIGL